eukprot:3899207-Rhodomonas_salina.1
MSYCLSFSRHRHGICGTDVDHTAIRDCRCVQHAAGCQKRGLEDVRTVQTPPSKPLTLHPGLSGPWTLDPGLLTLDS